MPRTLAVALLLEVPDDLTVEQATAHLTAPHALGPSVVLVEVHDDPSAVFPDDVLDAVTG